MSKMHDYEYSAGVSNVKKSELVGEDGRNTHKNGWCQPYALNAKIGGLIGYSR